MKLRRFGRTDLYVSELGLNTASLAALPEIRSLDILDAFRREGGNFIQNAGSYPHLAKDEPASARAEEITGGWLRSRAIPRDSVLLATRVKLVRPEHGGSIRFANLIRQSCEKSLRRLRTSHLDLVTCEWNGALGRVDDIMEAYDQLIRAGMVRHLAAGGFPLWRVVDSFHRSYARNRCRFEAIESDYSLVSAGTSAAETLTMSHEHRLGFIARSPLASGFLARRPISVRELMYSERNLVNESQSPANTLLVRLARIADKRAVSPAQIALAWVLHSPQVSTALLEPDSLPGLQEAMQATAIELHADEIATLSQVSLFDHSNWIHARSFARTPVEFHAAL